MAWTLTFDDKDVVAGESSELTLRKDGRELAGGDLAIEHVVLDLAAGTPPDAATLTGRHLKVAFPPLAQRITVVARHTDPDTGVEKEVARESAGVLLPWRLDVGPRMVDGVPGIKNTRSWDDPKGQRAKLVLHDLLEQLPGEFVRVLDDLPIVRIDGGGADVGGLYQVGLLQAEHIYLTKGDVDALDETSPYVTKADRALAAMLVHELAHAWVTRRSGGGLGTVLRGLYDGVQFLGGIGMQIAGGIAAIFCPPTWGILYLFGTSDTMLHALATRDEMSEFCQESDWRQRALSALSTPLIGLLGFLFSEQPPNCGTALATQLDFADAPTWLNWWTVNVHNNSFDFREVHRVASTDPPAKYFDTPDAVVDLLQPTPPPDGPYALGPATVYAAMSPMEDLSETATGQALKVRGPLKGAPPALKPGEPWPWQKDPYFQANTRPGKGWTKGDHFYREPSAGRVRFFTKQGLFDGSDGDVVIGAGQLLTDLKGFPLPPASAPGGPAAPHWRVQSVGVSEEAERKAAEEAQAIEAALTARRLWNEGPAKDYARAEEAVAKLGAPLPDNARVHAFFAQLECHGDGLGRLEPETGKGAAPGDVVLSGDARVRVAHRAGTNGVETLVTGPEEVAGVGKQVRVADLDLRLRWAPDARPRVFSPSGEHGPAYGDVEASLRRLIGLWGVDEHEGERLGSLAGFHGALARELALPEPPGVDVERTGALDVVAHLNTLGAGLRPYDPAGEAPVHVGDVVVLFDGNTLGVVTRVDDHGRPQDLLLGGSTDDGALAEAAGTPRMLHDIDPFDVRHVWRPDPTPRSFTMPDTSATTLTDPERSVRHALAHQGARWLVRREEHVTFSDLLGVLTGLLVEGEPDAKVRRSLRLGVRSADREVLEAVAARGEVRARGEVVPGDVVVLDDDTCGLVLEASGGAITQLLTEVDDVLDVREDGVAAERVVLAWTPSHAPREVALPEDVAAFYGGSAERLLELPADIGTDLQYAVGLDGERVDAQPQASEGLARIFAGAAPAWVRRRLWGADDVDAVKLRCDTLGAGLVDAARGGLPVGTWLFDQDGLNVVMAVDGKGFPALVYAAGSNGGGRLYPYRRRPDGQAWVPAVTPRAYTSADGAGYTDRNVLIGMMHVWGAVGYELSTPLFADPDLPRSGAFSEPVARLLSRGPDSSADWPAYLAEHGTIADGPGDPGDLLLFADPDKQAILLDADTMVLQPGVYKALSVRKPTGVTGHWKPAR